MADVDYPVNRSDANVPEEGDPWKKHSTALKREHEKAAAEAAAKKKPKEESDADRRRRYEREMNEAGKKTIQNAKGIPPELFKTMDDPSPSMGDD